MCVVQLRCNIFEIATILNEFNQSLERKKNLSSLIYVLKKFDKLPIRKFYVFYFMSTFCLAYVTSSAWIKNIVCRIYFGILSITLISKFNLSTEFSCTPCTTKIIFLNALYRICLTSKYIQAI